MSQEPKVTVEALDALIADIAALEVEADAIDEKLKEKNKEISGLKMKATGFLKELARDDYRAPGGMVKIVERWNITMPKDLESKQALFDWMREKGIYDQYATVQANSLKALFMAERETAIENGEDPVVFALPGMEPAKLFEDLKFTRSK